ncbi:MAG: hypothetical protein U0744_10965 [Gemmataceae bacterium]
MLQCFQSCFAPKNSYAVQAPVRSGGSAASDAATSTAGSAAVQRPSRGPQRRESCDAAEKFRHDGPARALPIHPDELGNSIARAGHAELLAPKKEGTAKA